MFISVDTPILQSARSRLHSLMDVPVPHPKDNTHSIVPLLRHSKRPSEPVVSTTISVYMNTISRLFVPKGTRSPKLRALDSTLAAMAGVPIPDIMVQGNWSSPKIFEKHYRLSSHLEQSVCFHVGDPSGATYRHGTIGNVQQVSYRGRTTCSVIGAMDICPAFTTLCCRKKK